tara:strand:- start:8552 stop:8833 length:282 start_codon:yes stop_codon:yes gene_type:complete
VTAQLVQLYNEAGEERKYEIVLFGYDSDQNSLENYLKKSKMAFPAVNKADMEKVAELAKLGETGFIPNVVLVKPDGTMVDNDRDKVFDILKNL